MFVAILMLWCRHFNKGRPLEAFRVTAPPARNAVEQLLTLQDAITQVEALIQAGNIILLKIRALLFAILPQVYIPWPSFVSYQKKKVKLNTEHSANAFIGHGIYLWIKRKVLHLI